MRLTLVATLALLVSTLAFAGAAEARPLPPVNQVCVGEPGTVAVCVTSSSAATCVSAGVGLQGASVCSSPSYGLRVCTSLNTALYGYCPTDLIPGVSIQDPVCVGKPSIGQTCFGHNEAGSICYSSSAGLQGAFVCVDKDGEVRACTSMYTALYGYCPTNLIAQG